MRRVLYIILCLSNLFFSSVLFASDSRFSSIKDENKYKPYFEIGGAKYFNQNSKVAGIYNFFIPLLQNHSQLLFADLRIFDRSGSSFEGNVHLGYRKLYIDTKQMSGVYAAFDRKRSNYRNNFNQLTFGFEYWNDWWFVGGNLYKPIGATKKMVGENSVIDTMVEGRNIDLIKSNNKYYDKVLAGVDAEMGCAVTDNLTAYVGGYYFAASDADTVTGPKIKLTYDYKKPIGRFLGVFDTMSFEVVVQHDKPRGTTAYVGLKFKIGLSGTEKNSNVFGFERHMTDLVRRDPDIVTSQITESSKNTRKYEILDESRVDENRLAWLVERNLNVAEIFGKSNSLSQGYIPFMTDSNVVKHFAIMFTNDGKFVVYYDNDSFVHGLPEDRNNPAKIGDSPTLYVRSELGVHEVGFENDLVLRAIKTTAIRWSKDSFGWDGIEYNLLTHNCQNFVSEVMDEYSRHKRIYLRRVSYFNQNIL